MSARRTFGSAGRVLLIAAAALAGSCGPGAEEAANKALVRSYLEEIVIQRNWAAWDRYFAPQITFNGTSLSRPALQGMADGIHRAFPDLQLSIDEQIAEGERVVTRVTFSGTHSGVFNTLAPTERPVSFHGVAIDRCVDGKVVEMWHQLDWWAAVQQITRSSTPVYTED